MCRLAPLCVALLALVQSATLSAQSGDVPPVALRSNRPILVSVSFVGNNSVAPLDLQGRIQSSATRLSSLAQLSLAARKSDVWRDDAADFLQYRTGTINIRYLNTVVVNQDKEAIRQLYDELGFHEARVKASYTFDTTKRIATLDFIIDEGPQYHIWSISFHGIDRLPTPVRRGVEDLQYMQTGNPMRVADIDLEVIRILSYLRSNGYPFASEFNRPDVAICPASKCGVPRDSVALFIDPGERYRVRDVVIDPADVDSTATGGPVREAIIEAQYQFEPGDWYNASAIDESRQNLYRLGVFTEVSFDTTDVDPAAGELSLRLRYSMRDLNEIEASIENSVVPRTDEVIYTSGLSARYTRYNVARSAITASAGGRIEARLPDFRQLEGSGDLRFDIPIADFWKVSLVSLTGGFSYGTADRANDARLQAQRYFFSVEATARLARHVLVNSISGRFSFQNNSYNGVADFIRERAGLEAESVVLPEGCDPATIQGDIVDVLARNVYRIQVLQGDAPELRPSDEAREKASQLEETLVFGGTMVGDHRNDFFSPTDGYYLEARGDIGLTGGLQPIGWFVRLEGDGRLYYPASLFGSTGSAFATRAHIGFILQPPGFPLTPLNLRFHSGGPSSNRGWGSRDMLVTSPADIIADSCSVEVVESIITDSRRLLGGLVLLEFNFEYRYALGPSWVIIPFIDVGNAYFRNYSEDKELINVGTIVENLGVAAGLNVGFVTPAGPLRFGAGFPIYNPIDNTKYAFQLSIGHAF